ncbi:hypothetical protein EI94DRAFT_87600 [Lactarius quietus]|nr:hypothetical protein EI94DRAFT_87600 [Lactarius quietus]
MHPRTTYFNALPFVLPCPPKNSTEEPRRKKAKLDPTVSQSKSLRYVAETLAEIIRHCFTLVPIEPNSSGYIPQSYNKGLGRCGATEGASLRTVIVQERNNESVPSLLPWNDTVRANENKTRMEADSDLEDAQRTERDGRRARAEARPAQPFPPVRPRAFSVFIYATTIVKDLRDVADHRVASSLQRSPNKFTQSVEANLRCSKRGKIHLRALALSVGVWDAIAYQVTKELTTH